jgi:hypothetical protein
VEQRPDFDEAPPADRRARRGAEVDAFLDHFGRRPVQPFCFGVVRPRRADEPPDVLRQRLVKKYFARDRRAQLDDALLRHQPLEMHLLEVEADELLFFFGRQVGDVHDDREPIGCGFRQRKRTLPELYRVHRRDREVEGRQFVGGFADSDRAILQAFEKRALRLERDTVDFVEKDYFRRSERTELGHELAGRRVDHLKPDDLRRLQIGAALNTRELGAADRGEDDAEECLADAGYAAQQQVAGVDLPLLVLVVRRRNLGEEHDIGQRLFRLIADESVARFGDDRLV